MKNRLITALERAFHCKIYRNSRPLGTDLASDIGQAVGKENIKLILDVGANVGQSTTYYAENFGNADIYAFEPVTATFSTLQSVTKALPRVTAV